MAIEKPLWMQDDTYPARNDRALIKAVFGDALNGGVTQDGLHVVQRGAGANNSVDVGVGFGVVPGGDEADQGTYVVHVTSVENVALAAAPGSNKRIDLVCLQIRDPNAGGAAGADAVLTVVQGSVSATPVSPAVPTSAIALAQVLRTTGDTSVTTAMITDRREDATPAYLPRWTTTQRDALTSVFAGYEIYNTTTARIEVFNGATWDGAAAGVDIQVFTANGTWTKPAGAKFVIAHLFGGGGGGGGGEGRAAGNTRVGGGAGGGGCHIRRDILASYLGATVSVTVGAAGTGGAGGTNNTGTSGAAGGMSGFGNFQAWGGGAGAAAGGPGGGGGSVTAGANGSGTGNGAGGEPASTDPLRNRGEGGGEGTSLAYTAGGSSEWGGGGGGGGNLGSGGAAGQQGGGSIVGGGGGGGGGAVTSGNSGTAGGAGGGWRNYFTSNGNGAAGGAGTTGAAGTAGAALGEPSGGGGGGGGASHTAGTGGRGGDGGIRGGGGGGGGGGTNIGGRGGDGGRGEVVVITYF